MLISSEPEEKRHTLPWKSREALSRERERIWFYLYIISYGTNTKPAYVAVRDVVRGDWSPQIRARPLPCRLSVPYFHPIFKYPRLDV